MKVEILRLKQLLDECEKHRKRVERAHVNMNPFMPLKLNKIFSFKDDLIRYYDNTRVFFEDRLN
ncbi:MAG: hypothetical protein ACLFOC_10575 [Campylobacterales bacterium]